MPYGKRTQRSQKLFFDKDLHSFFTAKNADVKTMFLITDYTVFVGNSFNSEIKLTKQPIGCKLEYQVRAGNASGQIFPSNTISVVL